MQAIRVKQLLTNILPVSLLILLFVLALITVFTQADTYAMTTDEPLQNDYGQTSLHWYTSLGRDTSFLHYDSALYMPQHGPIFEVIVAAAQRVFGYPWHTRAVVSGLAGVAGVVAIALCGYELGGWWGALLAALSLWLYPRFFGAIFNNSKDVPFASVSAFVIWSLLVLVRQWSVKKKFIVNSILVGCFIGFAASIRVNALAWGLVLALLLAGWWIQGGWCTFKEKKIMVNLVKQMSAMLLTGSSLLLTMIACWPYIALDPVHNLVDSITVISKYSVGTIVPFEGHLYPAMHLPARYAPTWLVIGSPPAILAFAAIGMLVAVAYFVKKKLLEPKIIVVSLMLIVPLAMIMALHSTLYDGLRQFLFLVIPLLLLAVYGFMSAFTFLEREKKRLLAVGLVLLALFGQLQVIKDMHDLHPYEYMYFSPLVGGVAGASGQYDMDYWNECNRPAAEWLAHNYQTYTAQISPTVTTQFNPILVTTYLPAVFRPDTKSPDFYIAHGNNSQLASYKLIHTETVEGYTACQVWLKLSSAR